MALPTLSKTWQFNVNNAQLALGTNDADIKALIYAIVSAMLGFSSTPWTVDYSCLTTGNVGTKGDHVNRWSSASALVASYNSAHSWIVLKQSGISSNFELLIDLKPVNGNNYAFQAIISVSFSAGFTGGTATAAPTATDQQYLLGANISTSQQWVNLGTDASLRWSVMQSTDGQCTRMVAYSGGVQITGFVLDLPTNKTSGWTTPGYAFWSTGLGFGQTVASPYAIAGNANGFVNINGTLAGAYITCETLMWHTLAAYVTIVDQQTSPNALDSNWPMMPCGIFVLSSGVMGRYGTFQDMWVGSNSIATGDTYPATGSDFIQSGVLIFPWNGGPVNLS